MAAVLNATIMAAALQAEEGGEVVLAGDSMQVGGESFTAGTAATLVFFFS